MICTSIIDKTLEEILDVLGIGMAEIRLDRCPLDPDEIETLFSTSDTPLIATCRVRREDAGNNMAAAWKEAEEKLTRAIEAGAAFVDLEIEAPKEIGKRIRRSCSDYGTTMIRSCHFHDGMPSEEKLKATALRCRQFGGEIVKVAAMAENEEEVRRVMSLYDDPELGLESGRLVAFAMGEAGRDSRLECLRKGAPFTYAALSAEEKAAPGQWTCSEMEKAVYGEWKPLGADGDKVVSINSSKSFAQRAIIAAALSGGTSHLKGYTPCGDNESAIKVAQSLGARVTVEGSEVTVEGAFRNGRPQFSGDGLDVGESGLLARLAIPLVAALSDGKTVRIDGCGTLPERPMKGATEIMAQFGAILRALKESGSDSGIKVPLSVQGPLLPGKVDISGKDGSQLISGLLMALPLLGKDTTLHVHDPKSIPYMFITCDVLRKFGIRIGSEMEGDEDFLETQDWNLCTGITFKIKGGQEYSSADFDIEGDWSSAANLMVAGALFGKIQVSGLDTSSLQADISIMDILMDAGASLSQLEDEDQEEGSNQHKGTITVQRAPLRAFETNLGNCPDLFPIVSVLAAFCPGTSALSGFGRLSGKECDRGRAILGMLGRMGVKAWNEEDTLFVEGESLESRLLCGRLLKGGEYASMHDHRMAMALAVASCGADSPIEPDDRECVAKSFPGFFRSFSIFVV